MVGSAVNMDDPKGDVQKLTRSSSWEVVATTTTGFGSALTANINISIYTHTISHFMDACHTP